MNTNLVFIANQDKIHVYDVSSYSEESILNFEHQCPTSLTKNPDSFDG